MIEVARIILQQIRAGRTYDRKNGMYAMMCWGVHNKYVLDNELGGLRFNVQGARFKGVVQIILKGDDTYTIEFYQPHTSTPIKVMRSIYCDMLTPVLDNEIESGRSEFV